MTVAEAYRLLHAILATAAGDKVISRNACRIKGARELVALADAGLSGLHVHDLRHTGNTMAAATGASLRELMERMERSSSRAAIIYQHASRDRDEAIAAALRSRWRPQSSKPGVPDRAGSGHDNGSGGLVPSFTTIGSIT